MTLSNVSDWLEENAQLSSQPQLLQDIDEDEDDGERERECVLVDTSNRQINLCTPLPLRAVIGPRPQHFSIVHKYLVLQMSYSRLLPPLLPVKWS